MTALKARKPTGKVAWPLILVEGGEKVGKSYTAFRLSASPNVGRTFVFDLGEGTADEYAELGPFEVVDHDGTFSDFLAQLKAACAVPPVDGKPNVVVIDSVTVLWESIKDWADTRARRGKVAARKLREDPDADIQIPMNIWNDAGDRWGDVIHTLRYSGCIGVLIARGKEVAKLGSDGQPIAGQTDYKIEGHKTLTSVVTAIVRIDGVRKARLTGVRSLHVEVPDKGLTLPDPDPLHHLVFDVMGAGVEFGPSSAVAPVAVRSVVDAKNELVKILERAGLASPRDEAAAVWASVEGLPPRPSDDVPDEMWDRVVSAATDRIAREVAQEPSPIEAMESAAADAAEWADREVPA